MGDIYIYLCKKKLDSQGRARMRKGKREMKRAKSKKERQNAYMKRKIDLFL